MNDAMSKADQHAVINDGLAIGCIQLGVTGITPNKQYLDMAFSHALRDFPVRNRFLQVRPDSIHGILHGNPRRKLAHVVWQRGDKWWWPDFTRGFDADEADELADLIERVHHIQAGVWRAFGRLFVESLRGPERRGIKTMCQLED